MNDSEYHTKLLKIRSLRDFAAICQFLHMFHEAFGLNDFDTDALEQALLEPTAHGYLTDLHSRMLRTLTQNRQISFDNWLKYLRREFVKRSPEQNPWQNKEDDDFPEYDDLSIETKVMILANLCEWQLDDPERFRQSLKEDDELSFEWRVMPIGYDSNGRTYWLFDDNRLYRENPPPPPSKSSSKKKAPASTPAPVSKAARSAPRQGTRRSTRGQKDPIEEEPEPEPEFAPPPTTDGVDWEPLCITHQEWEEFAPIFKRSKDPSEKALYTVVNNDILPKVLEDLETKEKERQKLEAIANRKRSSRIVIRELEMQEKARLDAIRRQELAEAAERRREEIRERREEKERQQQQQLREQRLKEREQRLKSREDALHQKHERKRQLLAKEAKAREDRKNRRMNGGSTLDGSEGTSTREQSQDVEEQEESWIFDCVCGVHGTNLDDGELMIACNKCNVWQHVACLKQDYAEQGKKEVDWDKVDFVCQRCQKKAEDRKRRREQKKLEKMAAMMNGTASMSDSCDSSVEVKTPQANGIGSGMKSVKSQPVHPAVRPIPSVVLPGYQQAPQQHHIPVVSASFSTDPSRTAGQHPQLSPPAPIQPYSTQHPPYPSYQSLPQYSKHQPHPPPALQPYPTSGNPGMATPYGPLSHQQPQQPQQQSMSIHQAPIHATSLGHMPPSHQPMTYSPPYAVQQQQQQPVSQAYPTVSQSYSQSTPHGYSPASGPGQTYHHPYPSAYPSSHHAVNGHGFQKSTPVAPAPAQGWSYPTAHQPYHQQDS